MTVKTTLSFSDRHHRFLMEKVEQGVFASQSAAVSAALELMIQDEEERSVALAAPTDEIRARVETPKDAFLDDDEAFERVRARIAAAREA